MDVVVWLRSLGLGKYEAAFRDNEIDEGSARPEDRAERRQVTVMFSDLVGSTALSAPMTRVEPLLQLDTLLKISMMARSNMLRSTGRIQMRETSNLLIDQIQLATHGRFIQICQEPTFAARRLSRLALCDNLSFT
jgi:hypothetical protein